MKANNEQELARAIMDGESRIELDESLISGVSKILNPSEKAWEEVLVALIASSFFWAGTSIIDSGPCHWIACVFVTLGVKGTLCAYRLLIVAKDIGVLKRLRTYELDGNVLKK